MVNGRQIMKNMNKHNNIITICVSLATAILLSACLTSCKPSMKNVDPKAVRGPVSPLNCASLERDLYVCDDALFAYVSKTLYEIKNDGAFRKIIYTSESSDGFFLENGFFYYMYDKALEPEDGVSPYTWILNRYDLKTGKTETVASGIENAQYYLLRGNKMVLVADKIHYIVSEKEDNVDVEIKKGSYNEEFKVGSSTIIAEYSYFYITLSKLTDDGDKEKMFEDDPCVVIQISDDCLLVCLISPDRTHTGACFSRALAWIIDSNGELHELINPEGYAYFAGNYCNGYYYCSFYRYKELHKFFSEKFDNDKLEGTWKVNVETFEQTKISDKIYDDIFVIGDKVIGVDSSRTFSLIDKG